MAFGPYDKYIQKRLKSKTDTLPLEDRGEEVFEPGQEAGTSLQMEASSEARVNSGDLFMDLAIVNGTVIIPDHGSYQTNIYVKDGKIAFLGEYNLRAREVVDARNKYLIPGIIDPHVHLGFFAPLREELATETKAALLGGVTTIGCYFGGEKSHFQSFPTIVEEINNFSYIDVIPHLVIATEEQKKELVDYSKHLGVTSFKVYMNGIPELIPDVDDAFVVEVMEEIQRSPKKCLLCSHTENRYLVGKAIKEVKKEKGEAATIQDWSDTHPDYAEAEAVVRLAYLAQLTKTPVYMVHISSKAAIDKLREIRQENHYVKVETTSPYLSITRHSARDNSILMEPPFRDEKDREALWQALENGDIDTVGTDNVTLTRLEKNMEGSVWDTVPGYAALETHLPVLLSEGVGKRNISLEKLITNLTKKPAEIFNIYPQKGSLLPGSDADIVMIDLSQIKRVEAAKLASRSDFSLYEGELIQGWPVLTVKSGEIVVKNGEFVALKSKGKFISR